MKKHLILVRHAKSRKAEPGEKDIYRQLNDIGLREASRLGRYLYVKGIVPDKILTSHAHRALETARYIAEQLRFEYARIEEKEDLYEASVRNLLTCITDIEPAIQKILLIGHNPAVSHLCEYLSGEDTGSLPSGTMAYMTFANLEWNELSKSCGKLEDLKSPGQIVL